MQLLGIFFLIFSVIIFIEPDLIAYIIATFLAIIGINLLILHTKIQKKYSSKQWVSFGWYEIIKKR